MILHLIVAVSVLIHVFFGIALIRKNFAVIDIGWGLGFILIALVSYFHHPIALKNAILLLLVTAWGLRLSLYILIRSKGKGEDPRYAKFRQQWGAHANREAYLKVFLFQGVLMLIVSLPVSVGMKSGEMSLINWIGIGIWMLGFLLEVSSDYYLSWYRKQSENAGKLCTSGPWRLCRFPNYFGEVMLWYGVYLVSFNLNSSWTILGPVVLNVLILKVTGVPLIEERYAKRPEYLEYSRRVPKFIPFTRP